MSKGKSQLNNENFRMVLKSCYVRELKAYWSTKMRHFSLANQRTD